MKRLGTYKTEAFLQKTVKRYAVEGKVTALSVSQNGNVYVAAQTGLFQIPDGSEVKSVAEGDYSCIYSLGKETFAASGKTLYKITEKTVKKLYEFPESINALGGSDALYILTRDALYKRVDGETEYVQETESECFFVAQRGDRICIANHMSVHRLEGKRKTWRCIFPAHSTMPEIFINDICFDGVGYLLVGAREGLFLYDYKSGWYSNKELGAFPKETVYSVSVSREGDIFLGTDAGAVLIRNGDKKYLHATRYAFSTDVLSVASVNNCFYTLSQGGVTAIEENEMTLKEKADYFFEYTEKYFPRKDGFVTSIINIENDDIAAAAPSHITDNDGLWSQTYLAALCLCYAKTKDKKVLEAARRIKDAMLVLTRAPGIKGFTARAVRYPDEPSFGKGLKEQAIGEEWHRSPDGSYEWLGETSSDEMTGHYLGFSLYYDLCATIKEKAEIKDAVCDITDHILENDGYLVDCDGKPTTWACWNEDALNNDSMWMWEKGINSFQMLCFLKVSYHMSGDEKYNKRYYELIEKQHYLVNAAYHKRDDAHTCHIDDLLGMCIALTLLPLETDPAVKSYLLMGLTSHWKYERIEGNPLYNFIYTAFTGEPADIDASVKSLEDYPLDLIDRPMINSARRDIPMSDEQQKWGEKPQLKRPFLWDERHLSHFGSDPFRIDGGNNHRAENGATFLLSYWIGRYYGIIE